MASSSSSDQVGQAAQEETQKAASTEGDSSSSKAARPSLAFASWASKFSQKASELKAATKDAVQQTKDAFAAEAKMVAKDMADLKEGVAEGMRLTVQDTSQLRERIGQQTRKVFAKSPDAAATDATAPDASARSETGPGPAGAGADTAAATRPRLLGPETAEHLKGKVQDLKAGGKKAAEKVRDVGGKLWHQTDHWFHQLRGDTAKEDAPTKSWEECYQHAAQLCASSGGDTDLAWALEELKTGSLQVYAKSAVIFHEPKDKALVEEFLKSSGPSQCAAQIAAYCQTPLQTANEKRCDVHVFSISESFLEISSSMDQAQRKVLREKLRWLCYTVSCCASQHQLSSIAWHLPGGATDVSFLENDAAPVTLEGLQELCKVMMKDQLKVFKEVDLVTAKLPHEIPGYFDTPGSEDSASVLFVSFGEPWGIGKPLQSGGFCSCSAVSLLCRPSTNPYLNQVGISPPDLPEAAPAPLAPAVAARAAPASLPPRSAAAYAAAALRTMEADDEDSSSEEPEAIIGEDEDLLDLEDAPAPTTGPSPILQSGGAESSALANGSGAGYPSTQELQASPPGEAKEEEIDWLDELTAEPAASAPGSAPGLPAQSSEGTAPLAAGSPSEKAKNIVDADFDALWDSMMDDEAEAAPKELANGSSSSTQTAPP